MYVIGPIDSPDHALFTKELETVLTSMIHPLPEEAFEAEEFLTKYLRKALFAAFKDLSGLAKWSPFLNRETQLKFSISIEEKGRHGILQYEITVLLDPMTVVCKHAYGSISFPATPQG